MLLHIGAALRHQFSLKDRLFSRMAPDLIDGSFADGARLMLGTIIVAVAGTLLLNVASKQSPPLLAGIGNSAQDAGDQSAPSETEVAWTPATVTYTLIVLGDEIEGSFSDAKVKAFIDPQKPQNSLLTAIIETESSSAGSPQLDDTLPGKDWFYIKMYPRASFQASEFEACLLYTSPSPRDRQKSRMPSSA